MSKEDFKRLQELRKMSENAIAQIEPLINGFEENIDIVLRNAPEEDKSDIEKLKSNFNKSFELAKQGKTTEAIELIKQQQNGCKGFKKRV